MICTNATELYLAMYSDIVHGEHRRKATDGAQTNETLEAPVGRSYVFRGVQHNVVAARPIDLRWAAASTLHFFADTEEAQHLTRYKGAVRFLTRGVTSDCCARFVPRHDSEAICECGYAKDDHGKGWRWEGAYGAHAMPQVRRCIKKLEKDRNTRRAVVTMAVEPEDINRPHCWTSLHFLSTPSSLDLLVYQRSLNLSIMPYDLINLTNILHYAANVVDIPVGRLHWFVGSLHCLPTEKPDGVHRQRNETLLFDTGLLGRPDLCLAALSDIDKIVRVP